MKLKTGLIILASSLIIGTVCAAQMETKEAVDPNGYRYRYVTNDPRVERIVGYIAVSISVRIDRGFGFHFRGKRRTDRQG